MSLARCLHKHTSWELQCCRRFFPSSVQNTKWRTGLRPSFHASHGWAWQFLMCMIGSPCIRIATFLRTDEWKCTFKMSKNDMTNSSCVPLFLARHRPRNRNPSAGGCSKCHRRVVKTHLRRSLRFLINQSGPDEKMFCKPTCLNRSESSLFHVSVPDSSLSCAWFSAALLLHWVCKEEMHMWHFRITRNRQQQGQIQMLANNQLESTHASTHVSSVEYTFIQNRFHPMTLSSTNGFIQNTEP